MTGKDKCKLMKEIRREIAAQNDIEYLVSECRHKGKCAGTCPKCEAEVRELERQLEKRRLAGKRIAVAGIAASLITGMTACDSPLVPGDYLEGDVPMSVEQTDETEIPGEPAVPDDSSDTCDVVSLEGEVPAEP